MLEQTSVEICPKCQQELFGNFCSNCGHPRRQERINSDYVFSEIASIFNLEKGIFFTIRELVLRPGISIQTFILEDRNKLVKPIVFIIICSLIYTLSQQMFAFEDGYINYSDSDESTANYIFKWLSNNYGYANVLMALFITSWLKLFFKKYNYSFFEILLLLCFVMGMFMLIFATFGIIGALTNLPILDKGAMLGILYFVWAVGQFFGKTKFFNYVKACTAYLLGLITFIIVVLSTGSLLDLVIL
jgi:hypothetical protein